jgi:uncharacterized glyoxalase superfamily protein PhnB
VRTRSTTLQDGPPVVGSTNDGLVTSDGEAERIFSVLSDGGEVFMPMRETFFATRFGQLRDRFGINWMILRERPTPSRA